MRSHRLGLRARSTIAAGAASLVVSVALALIAWTLVRNYLLDQRERVVVRQAYTNARVVRDVLRQADPAVNPLLSGLRAEPGGLVFLKYQGRWFSPTVGVGPDTLPEDLRVQVEAGAAGRQRFPLGGAPHVAVGVPLPSVGASYVEVFPLSALSRTLDTMRNALAAAALAAAALGAALGWWSSARVLRPVTRLSMAAGALASGGLDTRLPPEPDPDLDRFVTAFNTMADAVQQRIEREARFAADVSHELRTPLAAITASLDVLARRRDELTPRGQQALDLLSSKLDRLGRTVQDLLEITRVEAGADTSEPEPIRLPLLVRRVADAHGLRHLPVEVVGLGDDPVVVDKRRVERVVANLLENAEVHGGGAIGVRVAWHDDQATIEVLDAGPGIPPSERRAVFERFVRGQDALHRPGSGLGLALVAEHVNRLGGGVAIADRAGGGCRMVVTFPAERP